MLACGPAEEAAAHANGDGRVGTEGWGLLALLASTGDEGGGWVSPRAVSERLLSAVAVFIPAAVRSLSRGVAVVREHCTVGRRRGHPSPSCRIVAAATRSRRGPLLLLQLLLGAL